MAKLGGEFMLLKWAGGKRWQAPHLRPFWAEHTHRRMVEPGAAGRSVIAYNPGNLWRRGVEPESEFKTEIPVDTADLKHAKTLLDELST